MTEILTKDPGLLTTEKIRYSDDEFSGWFCIKTEPYPCPCGQFVAHHMTCMHLILVWPSMDDPMLLDVANQVMEKAPHRNPKVVEYENEFGPAISYYEMKANPNIMPHMGRRR